MDVEALDVEEVSGTSPCKTSERNGSLIGCPVEKRGNASSGRMPLYKSLTEWFCAFPRKDFGEIFSEPILAIPISRACIVKKFR